MTTQTHELDAWLGDDWTDEQREQIIAEYLRLEPATPEDEREHLLTAIAQRIDGTLDRDERREEDQRAQIHANTARAALRAAVRADVAGGMSELHASETYGVTRMTVRKWAGK